MPEAPALVTSQARSPDHERLDALWARMQAGGEDGETACRELARELLERRRGRACLAFEMRWGAGVFELMLILSILATLATPAALLVGSVVFGRAGLAGGAAVGAAAFAGWVLVVLIARRRREVFRRVSGDRRCGSCGYELRDLQVGLALKVGSGGVRIATGPPRCPECGASWPLMPAPEAGLVRVVRREAAGAQAS